MTYTPSPSIAICPAPASRAQDIADTALKLQGSHPHAPALDVLDLAMQAHQGSEFPDFDGPGMPPACSAFLPSPFARLLRRAFAPNWADADFAPPPAAAESAADTSGQMWALQVLAEFTDRYGLTNARERWRYVF